MKFTNTYKPYLLNSLAILFFASIFSITACSSSNFSGGVDNTYSLTLGDTEERGFQETVNRLRSNHQYELERNDTYGNGESRVITYWKKSIPFSDDPNYEAEEVETRITLRSRQRTSQGYQLFRVTFTGEYRALMPDSTGDYTYKPMPLTEEAERYLRDIATDLKDTIQGSSRGL